MDAPIVSIEMIQKKARGAFYRGATRNHHGFNWHAPARETWQAEWDRLNAEARANTSKQVAP